MMEHKTMLEKLQEIVDCYTDKGIILTGDTILLTDLGLNSYELVQIACMVEEKFDITIPDRAISGFKTVQNIIDFIAANE